jgi:hypothetical protein
MFNGWSGALQRAGMAAPLAEQGGLEARALDLRQARGEVAAYQVKATYESAAYEMTGSATKQGNNENCTPWGLLRSFVETGDCADLDRWHEWEAASKGRRAMTWARGLRARLALGQEQTDEELAEDEATPDAQSVALFAPKLWREVCNHRGLPAKLLDAAERAGHARALEVVIALMSEHGLPPPDTPPPPLN